MGKRETGVGSKDVGERERTVDTQRRGGVKACVQCWLPVVEDLAVKPAALSIQFDECDLVRGHSLTANIGLHACSFW